MKRNVKFLILAFVFALLVVPAMTVAAQGQNPPADNGGIDLVYVGQLLQALILATVPVLGGAGVRWLVTRAAVEKAKLTQEQQYALDLFVKTVIYAAEQMHAKQYIHSKLDWATARVQDWLNKNKIFISASEIRAHIEAAVFTEFNTGIEPVDPDPIG